jgi:hypothetical protein
MRYPILLSASLFTILIVGCQVQGFERDERQLQAKDEIREKLHKAREYDVLSFREDTLKNYPDSIFKQPIRYTLDFTYKDSTGTVQEKTGSVLFTPNGKSIISTQITDRRS